MSTATITAGRAGRARRWLRVLGLLLVLALAMAALAWHGLQSLAPSHLHIVVDGDEVMQGATALADLQPGTQVLAVLAIAATCFAMLLAVPLLLLAVAVVVLPVLLLALGVPLIVVLSVATLLMAPLALLGLLAWWLIRALIRDNKAPPSATMVG